MTQYLMGIDASVPPERIPAGTQFIMGYIGGDTPHVWTVQEWARFQGLRKVPIFTRSNPQTADPVSDGFAAVRRLYEIGAQKGKVTALDFETAVDPVYVTRYWSILRWAGYKLWIYGSSSTLFDNPQASGYWVANWNKGIPLLYPHAGVAARQSQALAKYDVDFTTFWQVHFNMWK